MNVSQKRYKKECGSVLTELTMVTTFIVLLSLAAMPQLRLTLQTFQRAQANANKNNTSYPAPLIKFNSITQDTVETGTIGTTTSSDSLTLAY